MEVRPHHLDRFLVVASGFRDVAAKRAQARGLLVHFPRIGRKLECLFNLRVCFVKAPLLCKPTNNCAMRLGHHRIDGQGSIGSRKSVIDLLLKIVAEA